MSRRTLFTTLDMRHEYFPFPTIVSLVSRLASLRYTYLHIHTYLYYCMEYQQYHHKGAFHHPRCLARPETILNITSPSIHPPIHPSTHSPFTHAAPARQSCPYHTAPPPVYQPPSPSALRDDVSSGNLALLHTPELPLCARRPGYGTRAMSALDPDARAGWCRLLITTAAGAGVRWCTRPGSSGWGGARQAALRHLFLVFCVRRGVMPVASQQLERGGSAGPAPRRPRIHYRRLSTERVPPVRRSRQGPVQPARCAHRRPRTEEELGLQGPAMGYRRASLLDVPAGWGPPRWGERGRVRARDTFVVRLRSFVRTV